MITLYGAGPAFGLPETSPYVTKTEVQLRMAGLAYRKEFAMPDASPKGQLPFIDDDGRVIADSTFIRGHIEVAHGVDLDAGLSAYERAQGWAIERMVENHFAWTTVPGRYLDAANFEKGPAKWFDGAPEEMRAALRQNLLEEIKRRLFAVGVSRHSDAENIALAERTLASLSAMLGDKLFLFGDKPTGTDAVVFAMLAQCLTPFFDTEIGRKTKGFASLVDYVDRMMARFFPEHPWSIARDSEHEKKALPLAA